MNKLYHLIVATCIALSLIIMYVVIINVSDKMPPKFEDQGNWQRFSNMMIHMDTIAADPQHKTIFLGASAIEFFLDPTFFDEALAEENIKMKSFNLAYKGNYGMGTLTLALRLRNEFKSRNAKVKAVVIELAPINFNSEFYRKRKFFQDYMSPLFFLDNETWVSFFIQDAPAAGNLFIRQWINNFDWAFFETYSQIWEEPAFTKKLTENGVLGLWYRQEFKEVPNWNIVTRGRYNWNFPVAKPLFDKIQKDLHETATWKQHVGHYRVAAGFLDKNFYLGSEEGLVASYIEAVKIAKSFAENVYLLKLPLDPELQGLYENVAHEADLVARIERETGVKVYDYSRAHKYTSNDFADALHPNLNTMRKVLHQFAADVKSDLD